MRVVNLGQVRDLLAHWDEVRAEILRGHVKGFALTIKGPIGESIYIGGHYRESPTDAARAAMLTSWEMTKAGM